MFKIICLTLGLLAFSACDFIVEKGQKNSQTAQEKTIAINIEEAQLLVKIAKINSEIITLSHEAKNKDSSINAIAQLLEKKHKSIAKALHEIASEKLILIPDTTYKNKILKTKKPTNVCKEYLKSMTKLLENQIKTFNTLRDQTSDKDFIALTLATKSKLKTHLIRTETDLNKF